MSLNPIFLSLGEVLEIHRDQIERYGGGPVSSHHLHSLVQST